MMSSGKVKVDVLEADKYEYFSKWHYAAIREILHYVPFTDDYKTLAKLLDPPISPRRRANPSNCWRGSGSSSRIRPALGVRLRPISAPGEFQRIERGQFPPQHIGARSARAGCRPPELRGFSTLTLPLSGDKIRKAKLAIKNLRMYLLALSENGANADRVYQFNFQLFPVTRIERAEGDGV
jgi:hypothetical protein